MCDQLYDKKFLKLNEADAAKGQHESFLDDIVMKNRELFIAFDYRKESFDLFLGQFLHGNEQYKFMWKVMVFVFTLPHGQSQIERGFNTVFWKKGQKWVKNSQKDPQITIEIAL